MIQSQDNMARARQANRSGKQETMVNKPNTKSRKIESKNQKEDGWELKQYVAGQTTRSLTAFENLKKICEEYLNGQYHILVIDLLENPKLAQADQIIALPTLVRHLPPPLRKIIGDLSDTEHVLVGLNLRPR